MVGPTGSNTNRSQHWLFTCLFIMQLGHLRTLFLHGCKAYMDSYMASNGSCFMVTWNIFENHFLEVGLTQTKETMALQTFRTVVLFYFIKCEDPHE